MALSAFLIAWWGGMAFQDGAFSTPRAAQDKRTHLELRLWQKLAREALHQRLSFHSAC